MGITGLLPFLEKASTRGNISQFSGGTVAIDTYCWLHKGAFSCAEKLALGQPTDAYVTYCMKFVNMLLANNIRPILVFDGCHLPAKKDTESKRRELRNANRKRAAELIRMGQVAEGRNVLRRSIDISHEMALNLIKVCHERGIDCIVAPYEADSQLAYLNISGIADVIITEDSDLTLFGCKKIFFKMDVTGNGVLVEQERFHLAMGVHSEHFSMDKFRHMCILSGCDYLPSLPGIGLTKACKFIKKTVETDIHKALTRLSSYLNMKSLDVSKEYRDAFIRADVTFKHQLVFCPIKRKQVRLTPITPDITEDQLHFAGKEMPDDLAWQLAIGNYDPMTLKMLHDYDPDNFSTGKTIARTNSWKEKPILKQNSIWSINFTTNEKAPSKDKDIMSWPDTFGKVALLKTNSAAHPIISPKRNYDELEDMEVKDVVELYQRSESEVNKRPCHEVDVSNLHLDASGSEEREKSPILVRRANPFAKTKSHEISPSLLDKGKNRSKFRNLARFQPTVIDKDVLTQSKFFSRLSDAPKESSAEDRVTVKESASEECGGAIGSKNSETEETKSLEADNHFPPRVNEQQSDDMKENCKIEERILSTDNRMETSESNIILTESSTRVPNFTSDNTLAKLSSALPIVEDISDSATNISDFFNTNKRNTSIVNARNSVSSNGLFKRESDSVKRNLLKWSNSKRNGLTALSTVAASNSPSNTTTLRGMQGSAKTGRQSQTRVNRKFQPVKRRSQGEQGQQCLLSSFGFQKKTGLQH